MVRVYFVYEDPLDDSGINLSFADVPTTNPNKAFKRVQKAAESGELWRTLYPEDQEHPYTLIKHKMSSIDISALPNEWNEDTILPI